LAEKIRPINGAAADLSSAGAIFAATNFGLPVSTTHVISSTIMGCAVQRIVLTWIITLPVSALIAGVIYQVLKLFF